jgi:hypothetical protein
MSSQTWVGAGITNLLEVLALELGDDLLDAVRLSVDADGRENGLDVGGGGSLVAGKGEEEVGSEILHFERTKQNFFVRIMNLKIACDRAFTSPESPSRHKNKLYIPLVIII